MVKIRSIDISPSLLNSSCLWASDIEQLRELYTSPYTGAVTTRTATLHGYKEGESNAVAFSADRFSSLNSYGYSPHPLSRYLDWLCALLIDLPVPTTRTTRKPIILSITASNADDLSEMLTQVQECRTRLRQAPPDEQLSDRSSLLAIELNTSCPNIPSAPPPSYHLPSLRPLLAALGGAARADPSLTIGLKLPPYPDVTRVKEVVDCIAEYTDADGRNPFAFVTCTNTLGGSLFFSNQISSSPQSHVSSASTFALPPGLGGLGGAQLHPIALGTVFAFSRALEAHSDLAVRAIKIIGVGGVTDRAAATRMRSAGASAVACATLLGREGVKAFEILSEES